MSAHDIIYRWRNVISALKPFVTPEAILAAKDALVVFQANMTSIHVCPGLVSLMRSTLPGIDVSTRSSYFNIYEPMM